MDQITKIKKTWPEYYDSETITLTNGEKLIRRYGKYQPGICFLISDNNALISWTDMKNMFGKLGGNLPDLSKMGNLGGIGGFKGKMGNNLS